MQNFLGEWILLNCRSYSYKLFMFSVVFCVLWKCRNKMAIEGVFPRSPTKILFQIASYLQKWHGLLKGADQKLINEQKK